MDNTLEPEQFDQISSQENNLDKRESFRLFHSALGSLAQEQQDLLRMKDFEMMSYEEIGTILKVPTGTAKSRLFKARLLLKRKLEDLGYVYSNA